MDMFPGHALSVIRIWFMALTMTGFQASVRFDSPDSFLQHRFQIFRSA